jgi:hypothetical protein
MKLKSDSTRPTGRRNCIKHPCRCTCACKGISARLISDEMWLFTRHPGLQSICIPRFVEVLEIQCLAKCEGMTGITCQPGSQPSRIEKWAFQSCGRLNSICIPGSVSFIHHSAFSDSTLPLLTFEAGGRFASSCELLTGLYRSDADSLLHVCARLPSGFSELHSSYCGGLFSERSRSRSNSIRMWRFRIKPRAFHRRRSSRCRWEATPAWLQFEPISHAVASR